MDNRSLKLLKELRNRKTIVILAEAATLLFILFLRFKLVTIRYFDIDEFAYLHWGYNLFIGERPYSDFLFLLPPLFLYTLMPLFILFGRSVLLLVEARLFIFAVFLLVCLVLVLLGRKLRNVETGLFTAIVFAFLPIPFDKTVEIRPDLVALLFALAGIYLFMIASERCSKRWSFVAGIFLALSLGIIPKTVFFLLPVAAILWFMGYRTAERGRFSGTWRGLIFPFLVGFAIPAAITLFLVMSFGNFRFAAYSMTRLASDIHKSLGARFYMMPNIFFYPNDTYYGFPGTNNLPYILNLVIYVTASFWGIKSLFSAKNLRELLFASAFFANLTAFVKFYPLKHAQYLIMIAPFIAFYFADLVMSLRGSCHSRVPSCASKSLHFVGLKASEASLGNPRLCHPLSIIIAMCLYGLVFLSISYAGYIMYEQKSRWDNKATLEKVGRILSAVPKDERVFDLTGGSIFFRHGYYFCCLSYGQYEEVLRFPIPNLATTLASNNTKYVHTDFYSRLDVLPLLQGKFIKENFVPYFPDRSLLIKK